MFDRIVLPNCRLARRLSNAASLLSRSGCPHVRVCLIFLAPLSSVRPEQERRRHFGTPSRILSLRGTPLTAPATPAGGSLRKGFSSTSLHRTFTKAISPPYFKRFAGTPEEIVHSQTSPLSYPRRTSSTQAKSPWIAGARVCAKQSKR